MESSVHCADAQAAVRAAAALIRDARYLTAFTGAGTSVESGIPPFRGEGGLGNTYDTNTLGLDYFRANPRARLAHYAGDLLRPLCQGEAQPCP